MHPPQQPAPGQHAPHRSRWILAGFLAIALFFLLTEHRAHLFGILPYLLLLACPLMHLLHGHGHHGHHGAPGEGQRSGPARPADSGQGARDEP